MFDKLLNIIYQQIKEAYHFVYCKKHNNMLRLNLSETEIQRLNYERFRYPCPEIQKRINCVFFKAALNLSNMTTGTLTDLNRNTVSHWIHVYEKGGFEALCQYNYGTNRSELEKHAAVILESFNYQPPMNTKEALARIKEMAGIERSPTQVREFMKRHGLRYIKAGHIPAKADPEKQKEWVSTKLDPVIEAAQNGKCHLLFMDAAHFVLQPFICALWSIVRIYIRAASGRNRINILGTVHAITKEVITINNTTYISADTIVGFLKKLKGHYVDLPITIVLDNARYQHCKLVEHAAHSLGITLLFLPSYSPNLNIIERLWKFTKKKILYAKYYDTPVKFHNAITDFFQTVNESYGPDLKSLLSLNFQYFNNQIAQIYTA